MIYSSAADGMMAFYGAAAFVGILLITIFIVKMVIRRKNK